MSLTTQQAEFWSGPAGQKWVANQQRLDRLFTEATATLFDAARIGPGANVLDVGCGAGDTTIQAARHASPHGMALGVDVSAPLLSLARERARDLSNVAFTVGDAQDYPFDAGGFDLLTSRFGLMFFSDPVAAFRNLRRALKPGGRAAFVAWAPQAENPWSLLPRKAGEARLGPSTPTPPGAPGQFAFSDPADVVGILTEAGFAGGEGAFLDIHLHVDGGAEHAASLATTIGPLPRIMLEHDGTEDDRVAIAAELTSAFRTFETPDGVRVPARLTRFTAIAT